MEFSIGSIGAEDVKRRKKTYDKEHVAATAGNLQSHVMNNIGNFLNGSMRPDTAQVTNSASNL